jgi:signal transduction histidine kinase
MPMFPQTPQPDAVPDSPRVRLEVSGPTKGQVFRSAVLFIQFRWFAGLAMVAAALVSGLLEIPLPVAELLGLAALLLVGNGMLFLYSRRLLAALSQVTGRLLQVFNLLQVALDWSALLVLIHWTGGVNSPALSFFLVHLVMSSILQPMGQVVLMAALGMGAVTLMLLLEAHSIIPHHDLFSLDHGSGYADLQYVGMVLLGLAAAALAMVMLTRWVAGLMRRRMLELAAVKVRLEDATRKRETIVSAVHSLGEARDLGELLERSVQEAIRLWGVKGALIVLSTPEEDQFNLGAMGGFPSDSPELPLDFPGLKSVREVLGRGSPINVPGIRDHKDLISSGFGSWLAGQGQQSVLLMPLRVGDRFIGAIILTCSTPGRFGGEDVEHFRVFCNLLSAGIDGARNRRLLVEHARERNQFFHRVAHDLRSPVNAMRSMLSLVEEGYVTDPQEIQKTMGKVVQRTQLLEELVGDLLAIAEEKTVAQRKESFETINLSELMRDLCPMFQQEAREKDIVFSFTEESAPDVMVKGERSSIERAMNNLLSNAVKYTPTGGEVTVVISRSIERARVLVKDTGIGIPLDAQSRLFEEFFRAPNARSHTMKGTGLGLRITRTLIESMGGTLRFTSVENEGSTFVATLPLAEAEQE